MRRLLAIVLAALAFAASPAAAAQGSSVAAARQSGTVGERFDGYLGYSASASPAIRRQVGAVNIRRRSLYTGLATRRQVTVQEVGIAAGCELLAEVKVGEAYVLSDGIWRTRGSGEAAPVPAYCRR